MSHDRPDAVTRLVWGLRRWRALVAACLAVAVAVVASGLGHGPVASGDDRREATALVVARELTIGADQLSRFAEAVFTSGTVERTVASAVGGGSRDVVPDLVHLEPVVDTIAIRVVGVHEDPRTAAELANVGAAAFVEELNRAGPGVGVFSVQDLARPSAAEPVRPGSPLVAVGIGIVAGAALAVGAVGLLLNLRSPVLTPADAAAVAGVPALAALDLRGRRGKLRPEQVGGLSALARQLYPDRRGTVAVVGCPGGPLHRATTNLLARVLAQGGDVVVVDTGTDDALTRELAALPGVTVVDRGRPLPDLRWECVLVPVASAGVDVPQLLPPMTEPVLFVPEAAPAHHVAAVAEQFDDGELAAVVFARTGRRRRRAPRLSAAPPAPARPADPAAGAGGSAGPLSRAAPTPPVPS